MFEGLKNRLRNSLEKQPLDTIEQENDENIRHEEGSYKMPQEEREAFNRRSEEIGNSLPHGPYAVIDDFMPQRIGAYAVLPPEIWDLSEYGSLEEQVKALDKAGTELTQCDWWPKY